MMYLRLDDLMKLERDLRAFLEPAAPAAALPPAPVTPASE